MEEKLFNCHNTITFSYFPNGNRDIWNNFLTSVLCLSQSRINPNHYKCGPQDMRNLYRFLNRALALSYMDMDAYLDFILESDTESLTIDIATTTESREKLISFLIDLSNSSELSISLDAYALMCLDEHSIYSFHAFLPNERYILMFPFSRDIKIFTTEEECIEYLNEHYPEIDGKDLREMEETSNLFTYYKIYPV